MFDRDTLIEHMRLVQHQADKTITELDAENLQLKLLLAHLDKFHVLERAPLTPEQSQLLDASRRAAENHATKPTLTLSP